MTDFAPKHGLSFADLYDSKGLVRLDRAFVAHLAQTDVGLHDRLMTARRDPDAVEGLEESSLLVDLAPHLEDFIGELFGISDAVRALQAQHHELAPLYSRYAKLPRTPGCARQACRRSEPPPTVSFGAV